MIMEHFEESLVLLRRLMCWRMEDVLYLVRNVRHYDSKSDYADARGQNSGLLAISAPMRHYLRLVKMSAFLSMSFDIV